MESPIAGRFCETPRGEGRLTQTPYNRAPALRTAKRTQEEAAIAEAQSILKLETA